MDILIIGGTKFLGRHITDTALAAGHRVTLFNNDPDSEALCPSARAVFGDRNEGLGPLGRGQWDAVIDTCGFLPRQADIAAAALAGRAGRYVFVSSLSLYADHARPGLDENAPVRRLSPDADPDNFSNDQYPALKYHCEQAIEAHFPGASAHVRPGLIVGPLDPTWRFNYWIDRFSRPGPVLAPDRPDGPMQAIDARDLAAFCVLLCGTAAVGPFNTVAPDPPARMADFLDACRDAAGADNGIVWADADFLAGAGVKPFFDLPVWLAADSAGLNAASSARARAAGLRARPLGDTVRDTRDWMIATDFQPDPAGYRGRQYGMTPDREAALIAAWRARTS